MPEYAKVNTKEEKPKPNLDLHRRASNTENKNDTLKSVRNPFENKYDRKRKINTSDYLAALFLNTLRKTLTSPSEGQGAEGEKAACRSRCSFSGTLSLDCL